MEMTETKIREMVDRFYARVRDDERLGPVFEERVEGRWPRHLDTMVEFWTSALVGPGHYSGSPRAVHARIAGIDETHFDRWLALFEVTLAEVFEPAVAQSVLRRARAMARGLLHGINTRPTGPGSDLPMTERA